MSEEGKRSASARQKRVQRLKRLIIVTLLTLILTPSICCVALFVQVHGLNRRISEMAERLALLEQVSDSQASETGGEPPMLYASVGAGGVVNAERSSGAEVKPSEESEDGEQPVSEAQHKVYLTFDDGPSIYTGEILDILAEYDIKATFFVVGKEDEHSQEMIHRIVEEGHTLGMHSYSHKYSELYASMESFEEDFTRQRAYLEGLTGETCRFYRFPGGSSNTVSKVSMQEFADYLDSQNMVFFDWNISSGDGGSRLLTVDTLVKNSTSDLEQKGTAVVLMHDSADKRTTVDALPEIIEKVLAMEDTAILPITEDTVPIQHIDRENNDGGTE
ncbi:MAG: polysaccharide deacetylase [Butyrivibrio sp.]|nr:polysaccharide deacetylase [Muribaculum sp.]MCM1553238.1 polysaccharide deacetylase [Butyrivibrio sp.]